jgi:cell division protein FtsL
MRNGNSLEFVPSFIIILFFFTTWAFFHIWTRHMATELGYTLSAEQTLKEDLLSDSKSLKLEISTLKSSRRLESIAKNKLGMSSPKPEQVVYVWLGE